MNLGAAGIKISGTKVRDGADRDTSGLVSGFVFLFCFENFFFFVRVDRKADGD